MTTYFEDENRKSEKDLKTWIFMYYDKIQLILQGYYC